MTSNQGQRTKWFKDEDERLRGLVADGKTPCQIAKLLDRSESSVYRRIEILNAAPKPTKRACMCCGRQFPSEGSHNRLCNQCRNKNHSPYAP